MTLKPSITFSSFVALLAIEGCATVPTPDIHQRSVEIYGEIHGTRELPGYFMDLVALKVREHRNVKVGLEITAEDIKTACSSLAGTYAPNLSISWQDSSQDGRHSLAMAALTCKLQEARGVRLFSLISDDHSEFRDKMIADAIALHSKRGRVTLALVGNLHARNLESSAAGLLRSSGISVITYVFDARKPSRAWIHSSNGTRGSMEISARFCSSNEELTMGGVIIKDTPGARWDRCISLERLTASLPIERRN